MTSLAQWKGDSTCLLDLFAAFDTMDHSNLHHHLKNWFGISDAALNWLSTFQVQTPVY